MKKNVHLRLKPQVAADPKKFLLSVCQETGMKKKDITACRIVRESIDARRKNIIIDREVEVYGGEQPSALFEKSEFLDVDPSKPVVIVGSGPAGLFSALRLLESGFKPIILERGSDVQERKREVAQMMHSGIINPDSNYGFGLGGAGAFSDGKLRTRSDKRGDVGKVLSLFCQHGADERILYEAKPHLGSDKLPKIIASIRDTIISHGGEFHFHSEVTSLVMDEKEGKVMGARTKDGKEYLGPVILASGHSAKGLYQYLDDEKIALEAKALAVGVRIEHPQVIIDRIQYHNPEGRGEYLPPADYAFVSQVAGRGVYSFCMCPGGMIVPSSTEEGFLSLNGMSSSSRSGHYADSGMVVELHPEDLPQDRFGGNLGMLKFLEALEKRSWDAAGGSMKAPAQRMVDFVDGKVSDTIPRTTYYPGVMSTDLHTLFPHFISKRLSQAFREFGAKAKGFLTNEALVLAPETRTSSPVRIPRDEVSLAHVQWKDLYPAGEGAGYAGGIVSAAMDGLAVADALVKAHS